MRSVITLGHGRYSTNTLPTVERSQPFSLLGHNGEINTIERLRTVGRALGILPVPGGSDSQDVNRIVEGLINLYNLDLLEAMAIVFPAVHSEVEKYPEDLRQLYDFYRWFFPCSAQGPAAVVARHRNLCLGRVDALGLRPLWFGESDYSYFLSSEKGVVDLEHTRMRSAASGTGRNGRHCRQPRHAGRGPRLRRMPETAGETHGRPAPHHVLSCRTSPETGRACRCPLRSGPKTDPAVSPSTTNLLAAFGWKHYDFTIRQKVSHYRP